MACEDAVAGTYREGHIVVMVREVDQRYEKVSARPGSEQSSIRITEACCEQLWVLLLVGITSKLSALSLVALGVPSPDAICPGLYCAPSV